jgi:hypothetical protein
VVASQGAGGAEQAAIAPHDNHQVAHLAQQFAGGRLQAVARQHVGDGVFENHVQVPFHQEFLQPANGIQHLGAAKAADDTNIAKLLHGAPGAQGRAKR